MKRTIEVETSTCKKCGTETSEKFSRELGVDEKRGEYCWECGTARDRKRLKKEVMRDLRGAVVVGCDNGPVSMDSITLRREDGAKFTVFTNRYFREQP